MSHSYMKNPFHRSSFRVLFTLVFAFFLFSTALKAQDGEKLFKQNCAVCHDAFTDRKLTGPGLGGLQEPERASSHCLSLS